VKQQVKTLSEGQKALLSVACLVLMEPSVLIFDEPSNHVNFRHLPALAEAINTFKGAVILVCHDEHFVEKVTIQRILDMGYEMGKTSIPGDYR
jgi:ATPase subunit of ABC transporter with duplicated ATPase domains